MSPPRRRKQCVTKNRYPTDLAAREMIKFARLRNFEHAATLREYYCDYCSGFHLTHRRRHSSPKPHGEGLVQHLKRMLKDLCRAKREASEKGWPTIEHETRIAYMRTELRALLQTNSPPDNATAA